MKVLLIDDNKKQLESLSNIINELGISYKSILDGKNVLEIIEDGEQFDAIICAYEMADINGIDLLKLIDFIFQNYPPIIITSNNINNVDIDTLTGNIYALIRREEDLLYLIECLSEINEEKNLLSK